MRRVFTVSMVMMSLFCVIGFGQIPQTLSYQGVLKDADGNIVPNGAYQLTFRIYNVFSGGSALWTETQMVPISEGVFDVILGSVTTLNLAFDVPYWLGIMVGTGAELSQRIQLTSSAYSMNSKSVANNAVTTAKIADGAVILPKISSTGASTGNVITYDGSNLVWQTPASGGIGGSGTANTLPVFVTSNTLGNSNVYYSGGFTGIGASPENYDSRLLVRTNLQFGGIPPTYLARFHTRSESFPFTYLDQAYIETDGDAYFRKCLVVGSTNPDSTATIYGLSSDAGGKGICGIATAAEGTNYGGYFINNSTAGRGLFSIAVAYSGTNYGIYGLTQSTEGRGVYGVATNSSNNINFGVLGANPNPNGYGVYSNGRFAASGTKSFQIDHPLDPQNKFLNHYCAEGPEPLNIYRGNIIFDSKGEALVNLPSYFEAINKDWTYTLTAVGAPMPNLHVSQRIQNNQFKIAGGQPGMEVSWQVEAVRNDRWVERYGAPVEIDKPEGHRGKYLNPELYGQPESMGVFYEPERQAK